MSGERPGRSEQRLPRLRLDELQARTDAARGTQDRVHNLLEAVLSVGRELDLPQVLRRIVEAAVVLVDAEYGALGVIGDDRMRVPHRRHQRRAAGQDRRTAQRPRSDPPVRPRHGGWDRPAQARPADPRQAGTAVRNRHLARGDEEVSP